MIGAELSNIVRPECLISAHFLDYAHHWPSCASTALSLGASFLVIGSVAPAFGIVVVILGPIFILVGQKYAKITRDLRRLDSIALTPLFSLWSEVIGGGGVSVLRSFGAQSRFMFQMLTRIDAQTKYVYTSHIAMRMFDLTFRADQFPTVVTFTSSASTSGLRLLSQVCIRISFHNFEWLLTVFVLYCSP